MCMHMRMYMYIYTRTHAPRESCNNFCALTFSAQASPLLIAVEKKNLKSQCPRTFLDEFIAYTNF